MMELNDVDLLDRLAERIAIRTVNAIPVEVQLWDVEQVAKYFRRNKQVVRQTMTCLPSFPRAIRLPSEGRAHPLYNAGEVMKWAHSYKEKH